MKKISVLVLVSSLLFITCIDLNLWTSNTNSGSQKFWAQNMQTRAFYQLDAERLASNSRCEVWVEKGSGVTEATAKRVADEYSGNIYVKMMNTFGYEIDDEDLGNVNTMEMAHYLVTDKTSDAKLTILLLDIKDGYRREGDPYVAGYFYAVDFFENRPNQSPYRYSNHREMLYLDTNPSVIGSTSFYETLAHEMQHLMNFVSSVVFRYDGDTLSLMDTWVDEGLSAAAQWVYSGQDTENHWNYYSEDRSGLIKKGNNFYVWDNHGADSSLANLDDYATVYLFFQYLRLQSDNPDDIYSDIQTSEFSDYRAVTNAESINSAHRANWQLLLRDWHAANFTNASSGLYGYKNDPTLKSVKAPMVPAGTTSLYLFPGEGVYSRTTTAESVPATSGNIKYSGLSSSGSAPNDVTGFANGARLTYNINTNKDGSSSRGNTTGIAPNNGVSASSAGGSAQISEKKMFSGSFKVDAGYFLKNGSGGVRDIEIKGIFNGDDGRSIAKSGNIFKFDKSKVKRVFIDE